MLGAGGVVVVAMAAYFGRLPVLFWFLVVAFATAIWCAAATTFESFMAARILNGFFSTIAQGGGLMFIQDMFYFHERAYVIQNGLFHSYFTDTYDAAERSTFGRHLSSSRLISGHCSPPLSSQPNPGTFHSGSIPLRQASVLS